MVSTFFSCFKHFREEHIYALFGLPHIRFVRLLFSAGTVFFSHNNSAGTVFFSQFQPSFRPANGALALTSDLRVLQSGLSDCSIYIWACLGFNFCKNSFKWEFCGEADLHWQRKTMTYIHGLLTGSSEPWERTHESDVPNRARHTIYYRHAFLPMILEPSIHG